MFMPDVLPATTLPISGLGNQLGICSLTLENTHIVKRYKNYILQ